MSSSSTTTTKPNHVVIVGGGVIGTMTAYFLAENHAIESTIVDVSGQIAPAASGKAGGFLALDWNDYGPVGQLTRRSFALHQELADALGADKIQYRRLTCAGISVSSTGASAKPGGKKLQGVEWAQEKAGAIQTLGDVNTIAQVHPQKLCDALWKTLQEKKMSKLVQGKAVGAVYNDDDQLEGCQLDDGTVIKGDAVLFAAGPWTANIMTGVKYHSVILPTQETLSQCVFFSGAGDPEVYVRPDNTAYCCGFPDPPRKVTEQPGQEEVRQPAVDRIVDAVKTAAGEHAQLNYEQPTKVSSCYLPATPDNLPIMGPLLSKEAGGGPGCFIATGHSCWGILNAPGTGESMASWIATGTPTDHVDMRPYNPARFRGMKVLE